MAAQNLGKKILKRFEATIIVVKDNIVVRKLTHIPYE
jgi:hypothetical protein